MYLCYHAGMPLPAKLSLIPDFDSKGMIAYLSEQADVIAVYLFGSQAEGIARPQSDIDIAILLARSVQEDPLDNLSRETELKFALARFAQRDIDVVILNNAKPFLRHQILVTAKILYEKDVDARVKFEVRSAQTYFDLKPMYDFQSREMLRRIKEGRFGERKRHHS